MKIKSLSLLFLCTFQFFPSYGVEFIDSLLLKPTAKKDKSHNLLDYVFYEDQPQFNNKKISDLTDPYKKQLSLYAGFIREGQNVKDRCDKSYSRLRYKSTTDYQVVKRSYLTTLQDMGLDLVGKHLPLYAKYFEFTKSEYQNLINSLVGNYCSQNMTFASLKEFRKKMIDQFDYKDLQTLPSVLGSSFFSDKLERLSSLTSVNKKEFHYTIELFKGLCSWGGQVDNYGLMSPLVSHPALAAMVMRKMTSTHLIWDKEKGITRLKSVKDLLDNKVICKNRICRKTSALDFKRNIPLSIGAPFLRHDLEKLYCSDFENAVYRFKNQPTKISKNMKKKTLFAKEALVGQLIALKTKVPDFMTHVKANQNIDDLYRSSVDRSWDKWAILEKKDEKKELSFEESLLIESQKRNLKDLYYKQNIEVDLQLSLGEYDRIGLDHGKITTSFTVALKKDFLYWALNEIESVGTKVDLYSHNILEEKVVARVKYALKSIEKKLDVIPWAGKEGLDLVIARSIIDQLPHYDQALEGRFEDTIVKINFHYGLFALGYVRDLQQIQKRSLRRMKERSLIEKIVSKNDETVINSRSE